MKNLLVVLSVLIAIALQIGLIIGSGFLFVIWDTGYLNSVGLYWSITHIGLIVHGFSDLNEWLSVVFTFVFGMFAEVFIEAGVIWIAVVVLDGAKLT